MNTIGTTRSFIERLDHWTEIAERKYAATATDRTLSLDRANEDNVMELVELEVMRQRAKWGVQVHSPLYWMGIIGEEYGEAQKALIEVNAGDPDIEGDWADEKVAMELLQTAASCISAIVCLGLTDMIDIDDMKEVEFP